jgi:hypothetical protein
VPTAEPTLPTTFTENGLKFRESEKNHKSITKYFPPHRNEVQFLNFSLTVLPTNVKLDKVHKEHAKGRCEQLIKS